MDLKKTIEINELINIYGNLLNSKQLDVMKRYYFYDNSLSEIAENDNITRQAVGDLINRVVKTLYNYEKHLQLLFKKTTIINELNDIELHSNSNSIKQKVENIKNILED